MSVRIETTPDHARGPATLAEELAPVLASGACVGCGACAFAAPGAVAMERDRDGAMVARVTDAAALAAAAPGVCPMGDAAPNEDAHAAALWPDLPSHPAIGRHAALFAGHVAEGGYRAAGSSGGMTTWLAAEALTSGLVDAVVHVHPMPSGGAALFAFAVSRSADEVRAGAKTRYYSVSMEAALAEAMADGGRFALIGVPCTIKAARNLAARDPAVAGRLGLTLSLICGHMKAASFAESLAWQAGIAPAAMTGVDFRVKQPGRPANSYAVSVVANDGAATTRPMSRFANKRWDGGYHRLKACDWCDDVFGETADVTMGDAWLPKYIADDLGTNVVVVRSPAALRLIEAARAEGRLDLEPLDAETCAASQGGGLRDRRAGLAYRLWLDDRKGGWRPTKRVAPERDHLTRLRRLSLRLRRHVRDRSFASFRRAKELGTIRYYRLEMTFWNICFKLLIEAEKRLARPGRAKP